MTSSISHVVRGTSAPGGKIRVMAVDDSVVIRHLIREALYQDPEIEFVGAESGGAAALARIPVAKPDLVTLDIEMPDMDGLEVLRQIRKHYPRLRTIMFSSLTRRGSTATFEALSLGADDYVAKAANGGSLNQSLHTLRAELIPKIKQFFTIRGAPGAKISPTASSVPSPRRRAVNPRMLAIGVSTGGPQALEATIPKLPANFPLPVLIVQHMPAMFTRLLAERLNAASPLRVEEAAEGAEIVPGRVLIAPGDFHLRVRPAGHGLVVALDQGPYENSCRPSVDALFRSLAEHCRGQVLSVVLTGMGSDGKKGTDALKAAGGYSIAQDEATSVVWGMPGAVVEAGLRRSRPAPSPDRAGDCPPGYGGIRMTTQRVLSTPSPVSEPAAGLTAENFALLREYIHRESGIALGDDKMYLLKSRLQPLVEEEHLRSIDDLCERIRRTPSESLRRRLIECITTHETLFFRDPAVFDMLKNELLLELARERKQTRSLRIWCAACSSGQEPYSLAMLLLESGFGDWNLQLLGTDLSSKILERAASGRYLQIEVNRGLPAALLVNLPCGGRVP